MTLSDVEMLHNNLKHIMNTTREKQTHTHINILTELQDNVCTCAFVCVFTPAEGHGKIADIACRLKISFT